MLGVLGNRHAFLSCPIRGLRTGRIQDVLELHTFQSRVLDGDAGAHSRQGISTSRWRLRMVKILEVIERTIDSSYQSTRLRRRSGITSCDDLKAKRPT